MILQVQDLIKDAMGIIGAIAIDEEPTASEYTMGLRTANIMLDRWSSQRLMLRSDTPLAFTLTPGKASYTVGLVGTDVTTNKLLNVRSGYVIDANIDYPLEIITKEVYNSLEDKNVSSSRPMYACYDPQSSQQAQQTGILSFYYTPDKPYTVMLETESYMTEFVNLTDTVTFEPAYYEALVYNLAIRLFRRFHDGAAQLPMDVVNIANNSLHSIMSMNSQQVIAGMELPGKVSRYNIYTDGY